MSDILPSLPAFAATGIALQPSLTEQPKPAQTQGHGTQRPDKPGKRKRKFRSGLVPAYGAESMERSADRSAARDSTLPMSMEKMHKTLVPHLTHNGHRGRSSRSAPDLAEAVRTHLNAVDPLKAFGLVPDGSVGTREGRRMSRVLMRATSQSDGNKNILRDQEYKKRVLMTLLLSLSGVKESNLPLSKATAAEIQGLGADEALDRMILLTKLAIIGAETGIGDDDAQWLASGLVRLKFLTTSDAKTSFSKSVKVPDTPDNVVRSSPENRSALPQVEERDLANTGLTRLPEGVSSPKILKKIDLSSTQLTEFPDLNIWCDKTDVKVILTDNQIVDPRRGAGGGIDQLPTGSFVDLRNNPLSDDARDYVVRLGLDRETLSGRILRGTIDLSRKNIKKFPNLRPLLSNNMPVKVILTGNQIVDPRRGKRGGIDQLPDGSFVDLRDNPLSDDARDYVVGLGLDRETLSGRILPRSTPVAASA
jgi:hypothetical protein